MFYRFKVLTSTSQVRNIQKINYAGDDPKLNYLVHEWSPMLGHLSWVTCLGSLVVDDLSCVACLGSLVVGHLSWVTCRGSPVVGHMSWVTCRGSQGRIRLS